MKRKILKRLMPILLSVALISGNVYAMPDAGIWPAAGENQTIEEASIKEADLEEDEAGGVSVEDAITEEVSIEKADSENEETGDADAEDANIEKAASEEENAGDTDVEDASTEKAASEEEDASCDSSLEADVEDSLEGDEYDASKEESQEEAENTVAAPKFTIKGIFGGRSVTFTSETEGAVIFYKSGSSSITKKDTKVKNGETVEFTDFYGTIYAKAYKDGVWSDASKFVLKIPVVNTPTLTLNGNKATIKTTTPSAYICYTTDGTAPSWNNGKRVAGSNVTVSLPEGSTVRAVAVRNCFTNSAEVKAYVPVLPVAFKVEGILGGRKVTMTSPSEGATIYYSTKTGSITTSDTKLKNGQSVEFSNYYGTVYARAYKNGRWSNVARLILKIPNINTPKVLVVNNKLMINTTTPDCYICYTSDGSEPTATNGVKIYGSSTNFTVPVNKTIKVRAMRSCFTNSDVITVDVKESRKDVVLKGSEGFKYAPNSGASTSRWSTTVKNYISQNSDGTITVLDVRNNLSWDEVRVDTYSGDNLISTKTLPKFLPIFGGFYSGTTDNYVVYGQKNMDKSKDVVVYKVVVFDKQWNKKAEVNYNDGNTTIPFDAGSLRMAEDDSFLYVRTCHEMYSGHQSNITFKVNKKTMTASNNSMGYASHSFNQFVKMDGDYLVTVDHGDAYPRSVVLNRALEAATSEEYMSFYSVPLFEIPGATGANCTGVTLGGFEISSKNYLVAINSIDHSKVTTFTSFTMEGLTEDERDIYLLVCGRDNRTKESVKKIKFTDYVGKHMLGSTPYLVKLNDDRFVLMWEEYKTESVTHNWYGTIYYTSERKSQGVKYVILDGAGNKVTDIMTLENAQLSSSCQPVYINDKVTWYINETYGRRFYEIFVKAAN